MDLALFIPDIAETVDAFTSRSMAEWLEIAGGGLWLVIVCMPLSGIDRRDMTTAFCYMAFCAAAAVVLVLAMPMTRNSFADVHAHLSVIAIAIVLSAVRWSWRRTKPKISTKGGVA